MQLQVGRLHGCGDPGAVGIRARRGTGLNDLAELLVEGDLVALLAQAFLQAARYMQFVWEQYGARVGRPPENRLAILKPGEAAVPVSLNQAFGAEIAARGQ